MDRVLRQAKRQGRLPSRALRSPLAAPTKHAALLLASVFLFLVLVSWPLVWWQPAIPLLSAGAQLPATFLTMWQVQIGIAGVALPILLFVIESARDERQAALKSPEVLVRESWTFLIIGGSFVVVARMGLDLALWEDSQIVFASDLVLFLLTIASALFAYFTVLRLIFSPGLLRDRSIALAGEKMRGVLLQSIKLRAGNNLLFSTLAPRVTYDPFPSPRPHPAFLMLEAPRPGSFVDIHIDAFLLFIENLPWRARATTEAGPPTTQPLTEETDEPAVWLLRRYGEFLPQDALSLIRLRRSAFGDLPVAELETQLASIVRIADSHDV